MSLKSYYLQDWMRSIRKRLWSCHPALEIEGYRVALIDNVHSDIARWVIKLLLTLKCLVSDCEDSTAAWSLPGRRRSWC